MELREDRNIYSVAVHIGRETQIDAHVHRDGDVIATIDTPAAVQLMLAVYSSQREHFAAELRKLADLLHPISTEVRS